MADKNSRVSVKRKDNKGDNRSDQEKEKEKKNVKKPDKAAAAAKKKPDKAATEQPKAEDDKSRGEAGAVAEGAEAKGTEEGSEFVPIELPPFEIITGEQMSPFYFKFQFRNVEYSSGRNKTLLCFRIDTPGGSTEPLRGYMEDEHSRSHVEEAFFQQVLPSTDPNQQYEVTWYVSTSPCVACAAKLADILRQRKKLRLCVFCSRLLEWEEPEAIEALKVLAGAGCKLRMMKPCDFLHVWETYVEKEEDSFAPWEDCQENYEYYVEKLASILK